MYSFVSPYEISHASFQWFVSYRHETDS